MSFKRAIIRLQLDREAKDALDELCERRGMTQISALSRLVRWFTRQDEVIQTAILGALSEESLQTLAQRLLGKIARGDGIAEFDLRNGTAEQSSDGKPSSSV
jgi:hypothetical protein